MSMRRNSGGRAGGIFAARRAHEVEAPRPAPPTERSVRSERVSLLSARLEEALVFIIHKDGTREYQQMTLRELYNYVLGVISKRPKEVPEHRKSMKRTKSADTIPPSILHPKEPGESFISDLGASGTEAGGGVLAEEDHDTSAGPLGSDQVDVSSTDAKAGKKVSFTSPSKPDKSKGTPAGGNVTYRDRLGGYLHPRDMRRLVTPFSTTNSQEIMVRRHVILLNCDPLRAIVLRDRLLVLVPEESDPILETLAKRIAGGREEMEESVFGSNKGSIHHQGDKPKVWPGWSGHKDTKESKKSESNVAGASDVTVEETDEESSVDDDEWDDLEGRAWIDLPFELKAVDAVLHTVAIMLSNDTEILQEAVYDTIDEVVVNGRAAAGDHNQKVLRALKNAIKEMSSRVTNFVRAITESLDDLEDLSLMNLSRLITHPELFIQPVSRGVLEEESDEPELILEVYMQQALSIFNQLDLLKGQVATSEELMAMQLDTVRNRLLLIDAVLSIVSLVVSIAALVGSMYGMNVIIGVEDDPNAFTKIVAGTSAACVVLLCVFLVIFYRALALPNVNLA